MNENNEIYMNCDCEECNRGRKNIIRKFLQLNIDKVNQDPHSYTSFGMKDTEKEFLTSVYRLQEILEGEKS